MGMLQEIFRKPYIKDGLHADILLGKNPIVYFVRHGETRLNKGSGAGTDRIRGWVDVPLDDAGVKEADVLADFFKNRNLDRILSSDLSRAMDTAQTIAKKCGINHIERSWKLRPWNLGKYQGQESSKVHPILAKMVQGDQNTPVEDGESFAEFRKRFTLTVRKILNYSLTYGRIVLAVSHFRDLKLAEAWLATGTDNDNIDNEVFLKNDLETASVIQFVYLAGDWHAHKLDAKTLHKQAQQFAAMHAPKGGVTIAGKKFVGGEFIPGDVLAQATPEQKAQLVPTGATGPQVGVKGGYQEAHTISYSSPDEYKSKTQAALKRLTDKYPFSENNHVEPPASEADMDKWLKNVETHPYIRTAKRLSEMMKPTDEVYKDKETGEWPEHRKMIHEAYIKKAMDVPGSKPKPGESPKAVIIVGPPGSGKTTVGVPACQALLGMDYHKHFVNINSDDAMATLPEYQGWNSGQLHEEGSHIVEDKGGLIDRTMTEKRHMIVDITGTNNIKTMGIAKELKRRGYDVNVISVKLPPFKTAGRVLNRFLSNPFGVQPGKEIGRYVPPEFAYKVVGKKPDVTYDQLKRSGLCSSWMQMSTDVPLGQQPVLLDQGKLQKGS